MFTVLILLFPVLQKLEMVQGTTVHGITSETERFQMLVQVDPSCGYLGPDYMRRGGPVNGLARKTGQPASLVCCLLSGS